MKEIFISAEGVEETLRGIQKAIGGTIEEEWGECTLTVNNGIAEGKIRYITFSRGIVLLDYDILFRDNITLITDASTYNPIHFVYCLKGHCGHRFSLQSGIKILEQFHSVIITGREGGHHYHYFPKRTKLNINIIQVIRKQFLKKQPNNLWGLNKKLQEVFLDTDNENTFRYFGALNLKIADQIVAMHNIHQKGISRILQIEGQAYQILSMHILQHDRDMRNKKPKTSLLERELKIIHDLANKVVKNVSKPYSLVLLSKESGLSQAKLQEGFKHLYARTVTEYIRHVRVETARDLMNNSDMNISEIVYSIGFSSRSYFSKIFKEKYNISPSEYKNRLGLFLEG